MKRSPLPPRKSRIPRVNRQRKSKREKRYKAFLSSAKWKQLRKEAIQRAGYQCEEVCQVVFSTARAVLLHRCHNTERLHVDHLTYARFGGNELPEDLKVRCSHCHMRRHALEGKRIA
jgi:5-methylcytosine-specific restriction endonuclease McrA